MIRKVASKCPYRRIHIRAPLLKKPKPQSNDNDPLLYRNILLRHGETMPKSMLDWQLPKYTKTIVLEANEKLVYTDINVFDDPKKIPFEQMTVVCIPQVGECRGEFRYLYKPLMKHGFRVISCDLRGTGDSTGNYDDYKIESVVYDIRTILRHAKVNKNIILCSSSSSAECVIRLSRNRYLDVKSLVLISPFAYESWWYRVTRLTVQPWLYGKLGADLLCKFFRSLYADIPADQDIYYEMVKQQLIQRKQMKAIRRLLIQHRINWRRRITNIKTPIQLVCGTDDPLHSIMVEQRDNIFDKLIDKDVWYKCNAIESCGHYPHVENSNHVVDIILSIKNNTQ